MTIRAIYKRGVLRLSKKVNLKENQAVIVDIHPLIDDLPSSAIAKLATPGKSFEFLSDSAEEVYTLHDGKAVH